MVQSFSSKKKLPLYNNSKGAKTLTFTFHLFLLLLIPQLEPFSPLDPQALCAWGGANLATRHLAARDKLKPSQFMF